MVVCERCHKETIGSIVSMFNLQRLCLDCKEKERAHPQYQQAETAERQACESGNFNFPGIGLPADL